MSDKSVQAPVEDTPADLPGPDNGTPGTEVNWQERYEHLQPEYTRASQEAAEYRRLITAAQQGDAEAISLLGFEITDSEPDDTPEYDEYDPTAELIARLERLEQGISQREAQEQEQELLARAEQHIQSEVAGLQGLDEQDVAWVVDRALSLPLDEQGLPDIKSAHRDFAEWDRARQDRWEQQRKRRAPAPIAGGQEGTDAPNWDEMSRSDQDAYLAARLQALNEQ